MVLRPSGGKKLPMEKEGPWSFCSIVGNSDRGKPATCFILGSQSVRDHTCLFQVSGVTQSTRAYRSKKDQVTLITPEADIRGNLDTNHLKENASEPIKRYGGNVNSLERISCEVE